MIIKNNYNNFKDMIDSISSSFVRQFKDNKCCISYSGGIDSSLVLSSLLKNGVDTDINIILVHKMRENKTSYSVFLERVAKKISEIFNIPLIYIVRNNSINFWSEFESLPFDVVFTGIGLDSCYYGLKEGIKYKFSSYGERFRGKHPISDFALKLPSRLLNYRYINHNFPMTKQIRNNIPDIKELYDLNNTGKVWFVCYPMKEVFVEYFSEYKPNLLDMIVNKSFSKQYFTDKVGVSLDSIYYNIIRNGS